MLVTETVFISEQITKYKFEALLEISDKFRSKFNVFSYMILYCWLKDAIKVFDDMK